MSEFEKQLFNARHLPSTPSIVKGDRLPQRDDTDAMNSDDSDIKRALSELEARIEDRTKQLEKSLDHSNSSYLRELQIRDESIRREMDLKEKSFRREHRAYAKALDEKLNRMGDAAEKSSEEIKAFKLWMGGIGVAVVLGIMGANATIFGGGKAFFDGGKDSVLNQQRIEALILESKNQAEANKALLERLQATDPAHQPETTP